MIDTLSVKKRDSMLSAAANGTNPAPNATLANNQIRIAANTISTSFLNGVHTFVFSPTMRYLLPNNASFSAQRTSSKPYIKGIAESYTLLPNDGSVWWHRRIVFASKRLYAEAVTGLAGNGVIQAQPDQSTTTTRKLRDMSSDPGSTGYSTLSTDLSVDIFHGIYTVDWVDPMRAKLDKTRITVLSDRLVTLKSGNDAPAPRIVKHYTSVNKTIVYQDEENGITMSVSPFSVTSKSGLGNIYVYDLFECPVPINTTTSTLTISTQQTLYWHEK